MYKYCPWKTFDLRLISEHYLSLQIPQTTAIILPDTPRYIRHDLPHLLLSLTKTRCKFVYVTVSTPLAHKDQEHTSACGNTGHQTRAINKKICIVFILCGYSISAAEASESLVKAFPRRPHFKSEITILVGGRRPRTGIPILNYAIFNVALCVFYVDNGAATPRGLAARVFEYIMWLRTAMIFVVALSWRSCDTKYLFTN